jgi:hypothetical protein
MRVRLLTHKNRRVDLLKEQKLDEMRWREARFGWHNLECFWDENYRNRWRQEYDCTRVVISQLDSTIASLVTGIGLLTNFAYCSGWQIKGSHLERNDTSKVRNHMDNIVWLKKIYCYI